MDRWVFAVGESFRRSSAGPTIVVFDVGFAAVTTRAAVNWGVGVAED